MGSPVEMDRISKFGERLQILYMEWRRDERKKGILLRKEKTMEWEQPIGGVRVGTLEGNSKYQKSQWIGNIVSFVISLKIEVVNI